MYLVSELFQGETQTTDTNMQHTLPTYNTSYKPTGVKS